MNKILVIDDEEWLREMIYLALKQKGFEVIEAVNGADGIEKARKELPDLILCDVNMEKVDGYLTLSSLRTEAPTAAIPFILMTGLADNAGMRHGMELGADDYLSKPFNPRELVARIRAILRHAGNRPNRGATADPVEVGPITLHMSNHQVRVGGTPVALTGAELRVLELLMRCAGQVISREALTEQALGRKLVPYDRSIDTHISNLRRKLNLEVGKDPEIKNVRGSGYLLTAGADTRTDP